MDMEEINQAEIYKEPSRVTVKALILIGAFILVFMAVSVWGKSSPQTAVAETKVNQQTNVITDESAVSSLNEDQTIAVILPQSYQLNVTYGDLGPQLIAAGAIDFERFAQLYQQVGRPLTSAQRDILLEGSEAPIVIDYQNAHFLLNFFWALGLVNNNPILTEGPMMQYGAGDIGHFASTGGWSLGRHPATELYAGSSLITLNPAQQAHLEEVTANVYRPCCNNHTAFADCNHGMAMLALLQLLASQDATVEEMFATAKSINGFWFPQQALETAVYFKAAHNLDYEAVDPRTAVSREIFSASGFQQVHQWLAQNNLLESAPNGSNNCGVG